MAEAYPYLGEKTTKFGNLNEQIWAIYGYYYPQGGRGWGTQHHPGVGWINLSIGRLAPACLALSGPFKFLRSIPFLLKTSSDCYCRITINHWVPYTKLCTSFVFLFYRRLLECACLGMFRL